MGVFLNYNSKILRVGEAFIDFTRSLKCGDGLFETIRVEYSNLLLDTYHFERLFRDMTILGINVPSYFTQSYIEDHIHALLEKNKHAISARVRLTIFRDMEGYKAVGFNYVIQTFPLSGYEELNHRGLSIGIYEEVSKSIDILSQVKTNSALIYVMAATHAAKNGYNDAIILNTHGRVCDSSIANVFLVKGNTISTPSLSEGCIAGVMRRHILQKLKSSYNVFEKPITLDELVEADDIFLTNAIRRIQWVERLGETRFKGKLVKKIWDRVFA